MLCKHKAGSARVACVTDEAAREARWGNVNSHAPPALRSQGAHLSGGGAAVIFARDTATPLYTKVQIGSGTCSCLLSMPCSVLIAAQALGWAATVAVTCCTSKPGRGSGSAAAGTGQCSSTHSCYSRGIQVQAE